MDEQLSMRSIIRSLRGSFIRFPHAIRIHTRLEELFEAEFSSLEEVENIVVLGPHGSGKSWIFKNFANGHPSRVHDEYVEIPVLLVPVPARCTPGILAGVALRLLRSKYWDKGNDEQKTTHLVEALKTCKVRILLLDEINHLVDRGQEATHYAVGDWIKSLNDRARIPFAMCGTERSMLLFETNAQLADRFSEILYVPTFSMEEDEADRFLSALNSFRKLLGNLESVDFTEVELAGKMAFATGGRLRPLRRLLVRAVELAFELQKPAIRLTTLERAFAEVIFGERPSAAESPKKPGCPAKRNPFSKDFDGTPLIRIGEPFCPEARPRRPRSRNDKALVSA